MSKYSTILLLKREDNSYRYKHNAESGHDDLFDFVFTVLQIQEDHSSRWIYDESLNDGLKLRIFVYTPNEIINQNNPQKEIPFGQRALINNDITPIIHIVLTDLLYDNFSSKNKKLHPLIPRYFQIMDSSIWNYCIPMVISDSSDDGFYTLFTKAINDIYQNYQDGLYDLAVTKEYADLNARILGQSYLYRKGHGKHVVPFVFHSESKIGKLIDERFRSKKENSLKSKIEEILDYKWRILLVDDKANSPMSSFDNLIDNCLDTKLKIIENRLESILKTTQDQSPTIKHRAFSTDDDQSYECRLLIEYVEDISKAKEALKSRKYDIILLDYLLDKKNESGVEYGYYLLKDISESIEKNNYEYLIGPRDCFFFMFISAYPSAVHERLLAEGINLSDTNWYINVGACPTNTPQLFMYNLIKLMSRRLDRSGIVKLSTDAILEKVALIFNPKDPKLENRTIRERAANEYLNILSLQYHYHRILNDVEYPSENNKIFNIKGSVLFTHFVKNNQHLSGLLEHLTHLVHIAAFGTIRQWDEMWEEYIYFKAQFGTVIRNNGNEDLNKLYLEVCGYIEDYILGLKSQQR